MAMPGPNAGEAMRKTIMIMIIILIMYIEVVLRGISQ